MVPVSSMIYGKGLTSHQTATWTGVTDKAFTDLKQSLQSTPTLYDQKAIMVSRALVSSQNLTLLVPNSVKNCSSPSSKVVKISCNVIGNAKHCSETVYRT